MSDREKKFISKLDIGKADIIIAHWSFFAPLGSGLYETTKELVQYENRIDGVIAGIVEPSDQKGGNIDTSTDPHLVTQSHEWALRNANLHMIHSSITGVSARLEPNVFFIHGSPEACLWSELEPFDKGFSMTTCLQYIERSAAVITFMKRHHWIWSHLDKSGKVRYVPKGVDLERFTPGGMKMRLPGDPSILYGEVWREIKDPFATFLALDEYSKKNQNMRFYPWGLGDKRSMWEAIVYRSGFHKFLGAYMLSGAQAYPEHWLRGGDMLISPVLMGEPSRVLQESLACGCPVISWDSDNFGDTPSFKKARAFDPRDLSEKISELYEEVKADPKGVRRRARKIAEEHYSMKVMADQVVKISKEVLSKGSN